MRTPPEDIEVGAAHTQEDIEEIFNTGFGYRISGINLRRDDDDQQYILLFANEDGPYDDSVTQGRFEYIGEGLEGDQSEDSQGNSALIDAQTSDIPIHFFYKRTEEADWEYQGLVDAVDYEFQEQDGREVLVFTLEHQSSEKDKEHADTSQSNELLGERETYTARIDRISSSGNGIIEVGGGHINVGPVTKSSKGEKVTVRINDEGVSYKEIDEVDIKNYDGELSGDVYASDSGQKESSTYQVSLDRDTGTVVTEGKTEFCDECGSLMKPSEDRWVCASCGYKESKQAHRGISHSSTEQSSSSPAEEPAKSDVDIDELHKRANESAVQEVPEDISTSTTQKAQYSRSPEIKRYVKARADGACEGCDEPAPFTSKTGEPYLHAHHIHELSDGGSDTPDTVVALCPNCHYRVHHGRDGDEYNEELLEIVQEKEHTGQ